MRSEQRCGAGPDAPHGEQAKGLSEVANGEESDDDSEEEQEGRLTREVVSLS